jgi:hypothetical protein
MSDIPAAARKRFEEVPPWKLGVGISAALLVGFLVWETAFDSWPELARRAEAGALAKQPEGTLRDFRIAIVHILMAGYLPAALLAVVQGGKRTVLQLQDALDCTDEECEALAASMRLRTGGLLLAGLVGLGFAFSLPYFTPPVPDGVWDPRSWSPEVAWHRVLGPITGVLIGWLFYAVVSVSRRMSRLATDLSSVDLLRLRPLEPFTRQGLTNALIVLGFVSVAGLMVVTEVGFGAAGLLMGVSVLLVAGAALLLPLRGVRTRIQQAKSRELEWTDARILELRTSLRDGSGNDSPGTLADLVAWRRLVADVPEWPITPSSRVRFAIYLLIPLFSWAAAAVVERIVNALIS